jgi:hypothetical protein
MTLACAGAALAAGCAGGPQPKAADATPPIAIDSIRLTGANHYLDLRYRVLDAERAQESLGPGVKPRLIDERTGVVMAVPMTAKLGSLRQTQAAQEPGRQYFVMFINGGVGPGSRVTAELGDLKFEHLVVE